MTRVIRTLAMTVILLGVLMAQTTLFTVPQRTFQAGTTSQDFTAPSTAFSTLVMTGNISNADLHDATKSFSYRVDILDQIGGNIINPDAPYDGFTWVGGLPGKNGTFNQPVDSIQFPPIAGKPLRVTLTVNTNPILMGFVITGQ